MDNTKLPDSMTDNITAVGDSAVDHPILPPYEPPEEPEHEIIEPDPLSNPEINRLAAMESNGPDAAIEECPTCHNPRRKFTIVDGRCDSCRAEDTRRRVSPLLLGWPEVRYRRNLLINQTDSLMLPDRSAQLQNQARPYRQALRDITAKPSPAEAWLELDKLEAQLPEITG